jgi:O-antigen/teichoic acid export membrane protein
VQGVLVARWLGPELYGVAALVMSVPSLVYTFFDARSAEALVKFLSEFDERGDRTRAVALCRLGYLIDFAVSAVAFLGVLVIAPWASLAIVHQPQLVWLLVIYASAFLPRSLQGTSYAVLVVHNRFPTIAAIETAVTGVRVVLVLGLVLAGKDVQGVVLGNAIALALMGLLYAIAARPLIRSSWGNIPCSSTWAALKGYRWKFARFLAYNDLGTLLGMVPKQLDVVLLGYFRDPIEVGYYKLAKNLAASVAIIVDPLQSVVYPDLSRLCGTHALDLFYAKVRRLTYFIGFPLSFITLFAVGFVPLFLPALVGPKYQPAIVLAQILFVGSSVWLMFFSLRPAYMARGWVRKWTFGMLLYGVAFTVMGILFTPLFGARGVASAQASLTTIFHIVMAGFLYASSGNSREPV